MPSVVFRRDHLRFTLGIICGSGSFAVGDHLRRCTELTIDGILARKIGSIGSFTAIYFAKKRRLFPLLYILVLAVQKTNNTLYAFHISVFRLSFLTIQVFRIQENITFQPRGIYRPINGHQRHVRHVRTRFQFLLFH